VQHPTTRNPAARPKPPGKSNWLKIRPDLSTIAAVMSAIQIPRVKAASVLKVLSHGRTKPCLILAKDEGGNDLEVVLKWRAAPELKATGLVCELISALLAEDLDLPVPKPFLVEVPDGFHAGIATPEVSKLAQASVGLNFGSQKLPPGFTTWAKDKPIPFLLRPTAAEIFAFDVLTQNPDRRQVNPNLLTNGEELYLCDHEQAFSFLAGVIGGWLPPWTGHGLGFFRDHVFFQQLQGGEHKWERLLGALEALTNTRLREYLAAVPNEWRSNNAAADRISEYLQDARQNRDPLFAAINQLLK